MDELTRERFWPKLPPKPGPVVDDVIRTRRRILNGEDQVSGRQRGPTNRDGRGGGLPFPADDASSAPAPPGEAA